MQSYNMCVLSLQDIQLQHVCTLAARYTVTTCVYSRCKVYSCKMCLLSLQGIQLQHVVYSHVVQSRCKVQIYMCVLSLQGIQLQHVCTLAARCRFTCVYSLCKVYSYNMCVLWLQGIYLHVCTLAARCTPIKYQFVKSFQNSMQESDLCFCCPVQVHSAQEVGTSFMLSCLTFTTFLNTNV